MARVRGRVDDLWLFVWALVGSDVLGHLVLVVAHSKQFDLEAESLLWGEKETLTILLLSWLRLEVGWSGTVDLRRARSIHMMIKHNVTGCAILVTRESCNSRNVRTRWVLRNRSIPPCLRWGCSKQWNCISLLQCKRRNVAVDIFLFLVACRLFRWLLKSRCL